MARSYTAKFERIPSGYLGQLMEWPEVVTEGATLEECRLMLEDAAREMALAYRENGLPLPEPTGEIERIWVDA
ncbi:MAG: type II toxin-antitoxin system HicB family antitoxin [Synergistaceae bacterium]|jgi:predicted RNase H-like HicB family nuclease|nr:type II toxin-antitoxin system HicB family antitoxin [Synergistaceae bacterium]